MFSNRDSFCLVKYVISLKCFWDFLDLLVLWESITLSAFLKKDNKKIHVNFNIPVLTIISAETRNNITLFWIIHAHIIS